MYFVFDYIYIDCVYNMKIDYEYVLSNNKQ